MTDAFADAAAAMTPASGTAPDGAYRIWPADAGGRLLGDPKVGQPDPNAPAAVDIFFGLLPRGAGQPHEPPPLQVALQTDIAATLTAVRRIFVDAVPARPDRFRTYYVRLFALAQLGLERDALPEAARIALAALTAELIDDEAGRVKNAHLVALGRWAALFAAPFAIGYVVLSLMIGSPEWTDRFARLGVGIVPLRNFMLLWIGCFLGVWLSYGIRTTRLALADLTVTDADRLRPGMRLAFAGILTMVLGIACVAGLIEVRIGGYALTAIGSEPMLAFLVGAFCGISELSLPASISTRAANLVRRLG